MGKERDYAWLVPKARTKKNVYTYITNSKLKENVPVQMRD